MSNLKILDLIPVDEEDKIKKFFFDMKTPSDIIKLRINIEYLKDYSINMSDFIYSMTKTNTSNKFELNGLDLNNFDYFVIDFSKIDDLNNFITYKSLENNIYKYVLLLDKIGKKNSEILFTLNYKKKNNFFLIFKNIDLIPNTDDYKGINEQIDILQEYIKYCMKAKFNNTSDIYISLENLLDNSYVLNALNDSFFKDTIKEIKSKELKSLETQLEETKKKYYIEFLKDYNECEDKNDENYINIFKNNKYGFLKQINDYLFSKNSDINEKQYYFYKTNKHFDELLDIKIDANDLHKYFTKINEELTKEEKKSLPHIKFIAYFLKLFYYAIYINFEDKYYITNKQVEKEIEEEKQLSQIISPPKKEALSELFVNNILKEPSSSDDETDDEPENNSGIKPIDQKSDLYIKKNNVSELVNKFNSPMIGGSKNKKYQLFISEKSKYFIIFDDKKIYLKKSNIFIKNNKLFVKVNGNLLRVHWK
jgi:hypothetical protein